MFRGDAQQTGSSNRISGPEPPLTKKWTVEFEDGPVHTPVVGNKHIFASKLSDGYLASLDPSTGDEVWRYKTDQFLVGTPVLEDGVVFVHEQLNEPDEIRAFETASGELLWKTQLPTNDGSQLVVSNGILYVPKGNRLLALDATNGELVWWYSPGKPYEAVTSVAVDEDIVYATAHTDNHFGSHQTGPKTGTVFALNPTAQKVTWSNEYEWPVFVTVKNDFLILQSYGIHVLDAESGEELWAPSSPPDAANLAQDTKGPFYSVVGETLYYPSGAKDRLIAKSLEDGRKEFDIYFGTTENTLFTAIADSRVYGTVAASGARIWGAELSTITAFEQKSDETFSTYLEKPSPPAIGTDTVYVGEEEGSLHAFE